MRLDPGAVPGHHGLQVLLLQLGLLGTLTYKLGHFILFIPPPALQSVRMYFCICVTNFLYKVSIICNQSLLYLCRILLLYILYLWRSGAQRHTRTLCCTKRINLRVELLIIDTIMFYPVNLGNVLFILYIRTIKRHTHDNKMTFPSFSPCRLIGITEPSAHNDSANFTH